MANEEVEEPTTRITARLVVNNFEEARRLKEWEKAAQKATPTPWAVQSPGLTS